MTNNYGQAELSEGSLIALEGDDLIYSGDVRRGRRPGAGSPVPRSRETVGRELQKLLAVSQGPVEVAERGYPGDTLEAGLKRWADAPEPAMLVLGYGYGDAISGTAPGAYTDRLSAAVVKARAGHLYVALVTYPAVKDAKLNAKLEPYRAAARAVAAAQRVPLVDGDAARAQTGEKPAGIDQPAAVNRQIAAGVALGVAVVQPRGEAP